MTTTLGTDDQARLLRAGTDILRRDDPGLADLLDAEVRHQAGTLAMIASASVADPSVLAASATAMANVTAEGYPGARYHPGTRYLDQVEQLAIERARTAFQARYVNVQPHSCSAANMAVLSALILTGGTLLGMHLDSGGHLTHGAGASVTSRQFRAVSYGLDKHGRIDFDEVARQAARHRPAVIVAGSSSYPRMIDFTRFREIADAVGAYLLADISHIAGLVVAGVHPSPVDIAHVTTTSTYKQLGGPRGGLILIGRDHDTPGPDGRTPLSTVMQRAVFPLTQGTPNPAAIAAKARALELTCWPAFARTARQIAANARTLARALDHLGHRVLTGGTDNHMVMLDLRDLAITGLAAEQALQDCGILANRNRIPGDQRPPSVTSGLRLGTNILTQRGMGTPEMLQCARLVDTVLRATDPTHVKARIRDSVRAEVAALCTRFPLPSYHDAPETAT